MRFYCPMGFFNKQWFIHIFFRETGKPHVMQVGKSKIRFGRDDPDYIGVLAYACVEARDEDASIEIFPGARVLAVVASPTKNYDPNFVKTLNPERDEVEFVKPTNVLEISDLSLAVEMAGAGGSDALRRQIEVIQGKRKRVS
jgi:hypothetical protein